MPRSLLSCTPALLVVVKRTTSMGAIETPGPNYTTPVLIKVSVRSATPIGVPDRRVRRRQAALR